MKLSFFAIPGDSFIIHYPLALITITPRTMNNNNNSDDDSVSDGSSVLGLGDVDFSGVDFDVNETCASGFNDHIHCERIVRLSREVKLNSRSFKSVSFKSEILRLYFCKIR